MLFHEIRMRYPWWNRTEGRDHFFVSATAAVCPALPCPALPALLPVGGRVLFQLLRPRSPSKRCSWHALPLTPHLACPGLLPVHRLTLSLPFHPTPPPIQPHPALKFTTADVGSCIPEGLAEQAIKLTHWGFHSS